MGYVVKGEEYKAALRKNLAKIKTDSKNLDKQAKKSFMFRMLQGVFDFYKAQLQRLTLQNGINPRKRQ